MIMMQNNVQNYGDETIDCASVCTRSDHDVKPPQNVS